MRDVCNMCNARNMCNMRTVCTVCTMCTTPTKPTNRTKPTNYTKPTVFPNPRFSMKRKPHGPGSSARTRAMESCHGPPTRRAVRGTTQVGVRASSTGRNGGIYRAPPTPTGGRFVSHPRLLVLTS